MVKGIAFALFIALLAAGLIYGVARGLYSSERAVLTGTVASVRAGSDGHKSTPGAASSIEVSLEDGRKIHVATPVIGGLSEGAAVQISEMATPWGQIWYKLKNH